MAYDRTVEEPRILTSGSGDCSNKSNELND
jgi:hypothetical protein